MKTYETTFVINPQTDDATIEKHVNDVASIITGKNGKILHQNQMGTRRLAYEINGLTQGYYANFLYEAPSDVLPMLDKHFKTNEMYLRNLTVRFDSDVDKYLKHLTGSYPTSHQQEDKKPAEKLAEKPAEKTEEKKETASAPAEETPAEESAEKPAEEITESAASSEAGDNEADKE